MKTKTIGTMLPALGLTILSALFGLLLLDQLPEMIPIHFDLSGTIDGQAAKPGGVFILPGISLIVVLGLSLIASLDHKLLNEPDGRSSIAKFLGAIAFLFTGLQVGLLLTAMYPERQPMNLILFLSMGIFMIVFGLAMRRIPMNTWIGFRYPWNRDNLRSWNRTHDLYYRWLIVFGVFSILFGLFAPLPAVSLGLLLLALFIPGVLSYRFAKSGGGSHGGHRDHHGGRRRSRHRRGRGGPPSEGGPGKPERKPGPPTPVKPASE